MSFSLFHFWSCVKTAMYHESLKVRLGVCLFLVSAILFTLSACDSDQTQDLQNSEEMSMAGIDTAGMVTGGSMSAQGGTMNRDTLAGSASDEMVAGEARADEDPWIRLGTGFRRFEELMTGQEVPIIAGIQGGFHVWGGFVGRGFDDIDVRIIYSLDLDGAPFAAADYFEFDLPRNSRSEFEYAGVSVIYFNNDDVELTTGQEMTLKVEVITRDGMTLQDEQRLTPICCE
jgi:hypothetical protein